MRQTGESDPYDMSISTYLWKQFEVLVIIYNELLVVVLTLTAFFFLWRTVL